MRELNIEQRLRNLEENVASIKQMVEELLTKQTGKPAGEGSEIMKVKEVAAFLNLDVNVVYAKCNKGAIPFFKLGKGYRFKKSEIIRWLEGQKEAPELSVDDYVDRYLQKNILKG